MFSNLKRSKGFTLIEVVIVLAIAALIVLVVLQAVASAQKSQRDTARKSEASRLYSLMTQYASNNDGDYPVAPAADANFSTALASYDATLASDYKNATSCGTVNSDTKRVIYARSASSNKSATLKVCLEQGGAVDIVK